MSLITVVKFPPMKSKKAANAPKSTARRTAHIPYYTYQSTSDFSSNPYASRATFVVALSRYCPEDACYDGENPEEDHDVEQGRPYGLQRIATLEEIGVAHELGKDEDCNC